jgi:hypothetical protein
VRGDWISSFIAIAGSAGAAHDGPACCQWCPSPDCHTSSACKGDGTPLSFDVSTPTEPVARKCDGGGHFGGAGTLALVAGRCLSAEDLGRFLLAGRSDGC